jgi:hypothetical protein
MGEESVGADPHPLLSSCVGAKPTREIRLLVTDGSISFCRVYERPDGSKPLKELEGEELLQVVQAFLRQRIAEAIDKRLLPFIVEKFDGVVAIDGQGDGYEINVVIAVGKLEPAEPPESDILPATVADVAAMGISIKGAG